jgi:hypothetical protein
VNKIKAADNKEVRYIDKPSFRTFCNAVIFDGCFGGFQPPTVSKMPTKQPPGWAALHSGDNLDCQYN